MKQQISSIIDADMHLDDATPIFDVMESSQQLRQTWAEYHLIGDVMRGEAVLSKNFTANVMQQLAQQPVVLAPAATKSARVSQLQRPHIAWAVAASLVAVAVVGWFVVAELQPTQVPMANNQQDDYLAAHQSAVPSSTAFLLEPVSTENK